MTRKNRYLSIIGLLSISLLFAGCAKQKTLYYWGDYQSNLYDYYKVDKTSIEEQISSLQSIIEKAKSFGMSVPPGLHAQLGLLYAQTGQKTDALKQFETEKQLFPESAHFIQFIQEKYNGKRKK